MANIQKMIQSRYEKAECFIKELKMEVAELKSRSSQLEHLSKSEDHHHFLQSFPTLWSPLNKDWANTGVRSDLTFEAV